jgi:hypothetical protein
MILSYSNKIFGEKKRHRIKAEITTEHSASSYDQPVIVLEDGGALGLMSWVSLDYRVIRASKKEMAALAKMGLL